MRLIAQSVASAGQPAVWGGQAAGVAGRDPVGGACVPASLLSGASGTPSACHPPGHSLPVLGTPLAFWGPGFSAHLPPPPVFPLRSTSPFSLLQICLPSLCHTVLSTGFLALSLPFHQPRPSLSYHSLPATSILCRCLQGPPSAPHFPSPSLIWSSPSPLPLSFNQGLRPLSAYFSVPYSSLSL